MEESELDSLGMDDINQVGGHNIWDTMLRCNLIVLLWLHNFFFNHDKFQENGPEILRIVYCGPYPVQLLYEQWLLK